MNDRPDNTDPDQPQRKGALIAIIVIAAIVVGGYMLSAKLRSSTATEDCLMAGRKNCAPIAADGGGVAK